MYAFLPPDFKPYTLSTKAAYSFLKHALPNPMTNKCDGSYCKVQSLKPNSGNLTLVTRMLLRLVLLRQHGRISENEWRAISRLQSHTMSYQVGDDVDRQAVNEAVGLVMEMTSAGLAEDDLVDLYWSVSWSTGQWT